MDGPLLVRCRANGHGKKRCEALPPTAGLEAIAVLSTRDRERHEVTNINMNEL